ncbi:MAG: UPF0280 family protein [Proteobacteria bacterium]|nr:UPF0280 family protein [Pseudomonadota bacterium]
MKDSYNDRFYRQWMGRDNLKRFQVKVKESDLFILCSKKMEKLAYATLAEVRRQIEIYIGENKPFAVSFEPLPVAEDAPGVVSKMARAADFWNVGPMAAVAGVIAEDVGRRLAEECDVVMVENGGDVYVRAPEPVRFALYAGEDSPFTDKVTFEVAAPHGLGVCTSSAVVGPSLSFGKADAVVAIHNDTAFADAAATSLANRIKTKDDVDRIVGEQEKRETLHGLIACCGDRLGIWGAVELV